MKSQSRKPGYSLLPCPFCGSQPEWVHLANPDSRSRIKCPECQFTMMQDRPDKVAGYWNRRSPITREPNNNQELIKAYNELDSLVRQRLRDKLSNGMKMSMTHMIFKQLSEIADIKSREPKEMPTEDQMLICPFCREGDFDAIGLKYHLYNHCRNYKDVPLP